MTACEAAFVCLLLTSLVRWSRLLHRPGCGQSLPAPQGSRNFHHIPAILSRSTLPGLWSAVGQTHFAFEVIPWIVFIIRLWRVGGSASLPLQTPPGKGFFPPLSAPSTFPLCSPEAWGADPPSILQDSWSSYILCPGTNSRLTAR